MYICVQLSLFAIQKRLAKHCKLTTTLKKKKKEKKESNPSRQEVATKLPFFKQWSGEVQHTQKEYSRLSPTSMRTMLGPEFHVQKSEGSSWSTNQCTRTPEVAVSLGALMKTTKRWNGVRLVE